MKRNSIATAILAGFLGFANDSSAVNLAPNGLGQVLVYPYYTVEAGQQTLLTVANTSGIGKAVKVRFLEAYNGREVLIFNLFLSRYDVWAAEIFALSDAGLAGDAAAIFSADNSCTAPAFTQGPLSNGFHYQAFLPYAFTGSSSDTGPGTDGRTREGHFEVIAMADVIPASKLDVDIRHVNSVPAGCAFAQADFEAQTDTLPPTSGLFGAASLVNVSDGTFYAYNANAIDGFTYVSLNSTMGDAQPTLASANDRDNPHTATSHVFADGELLTSTFANPIDAVSSVFAAENVYNEYVTAQDGSIGTDWVLTFPTKRFYVDPLLVAAVVPPFEHRFGAAEYGNDLGMSCAVVSANAFDREENVFHDTHCGFSTCPPRPPRAMCLETNVIRFAAASILGSELPAQESDSLSQGMLRLNLTLPWHAMRPATNGNIFHGLPVTGFAVTRFVNNFVPHPGGGYALANYTAAYPHRQTVNCTGNNADPCS